MKRSKVLETLTRIKTELTRRFGVAGLKDFGSSARDKAGTDSDVDMVVTFDGPSTSHRYFDAQIQLEDALGCPVDLLAEKALRPELRKRIEREAVSF